MQEYMSLGPTKNDTAVEPRVSGGENPLCQAHLRHLPTDN
ncbi:Uncharacterised protein [Mycobacteroides abscessus subsp. abscessus]|nr:Uncharacterised protein [Mycobacteroides abscessus subsp. abscessus]